MRFKPGDMVIKNTGGNKMKVVELKDNLIECIWATDEIHQGTFNEEDIISVNDYKTTENRNDIINNILGE